MESSKTSGWWMKTLVAVLAFCVFLEIAHGLPVAKEKRQNTDYPAAASYSPPVASYSPPVADTNPTPQYASSGDSSVAPYKPAASSSVTDPYAISSLYSLPDVYFQMPQAASYPGLDAYAVPPQYQYQSSSINPYGQPLVSPYSTPGAQPYPSMLDPYAQILVVPNVDPYPGMMSYQSSPSMDQYLPLLQAMYQSQTPQQSSYTSYNPPAPYQPQSYPISQSYQPAPSPVVVEQDTYLAITHHTVNERKHCGILPATNDALYSSDPLPGGVNDVVPYGQFPWLVLIVDKDDYTVACLGTLIHSGLVITVASCITKPASRYTVIRDWDILTLYNEYEPYSSYEDPVCAYFPLGVDNSTGVSEYTLNSPYPELILLVGALTPVSARPTNKYPADKLLCLPSGSSGLPSYSNNYPAPGYPSYPGPPPPPPTYSPPPPPSYSPPPPPSYSPPPPPSYTPPPPPSYSPPPPPSYSPPYSPPYPQISYASPMQKAECWVAGYHNSPNAILQNHPPSTPVEASGSSQAYPQSSDYQQQYYGTLDNSKVPRRALVRQVQCPQGGYSYSGYDDVCFVGVDGYDACVADKGTAIVCVINDDTNYQSGFADDPTRDVSTVPYGGPQQSYPAYQQQQTPYQKPIQAIPAPPKQTRRRAVLYAVVKSTATCLASGQSPMPYQQQQSNVIVGSRISPSIKSAIQDLFWGSAYDYSCPTEGPGDVLPDGSYGSSSGSPPMPYSLTNSLQPQQYDPSLSMMTASAYQQPPPSPQPANMYSQVSYTG